MSFKEQFTKLLEDSEKLCQDIAIDISKEKSDILTIDDVTVHHHANAFDIYIDFYLKNNTNEEKYLKGYILSSNGVNSQQEAIHNNDDDFGTTFDDTSFDSMDENINKELNRIVNKILK